MDSGYRWQCARAGRRAGKSHATAYWLTDGWQVRPGQICLFVARTRGHARDIIWDVLQELNEREGWGAKLLENPRLEMVFPNGYRIRLRGAETLKEVEKLRGPKYWRVVIDESHTFPDQLYRHLITKVVQPALTDLRGELILSGTPGYELSGMWFELSADPEDFPTELAGKEPWPTWSWDMRDNPFIPDPEAEMAEARRLNNWEEDHPDYLREWLGMWVRNTVEKVYADVYDPERNTYLDVDYEREGALWRPGVEGLKTVISVDIGWEDGCGFSVCQKRIDSTVIRSPETYRTVGIDDHAIASECKRLMRKYKTRWVFVDSKGNKVTCMSLRAFGVPAEPAVGGEKRPNIQFVRSLLQQGNLVAHAQECADLIGDWQVLPWGYTKTRDADGNEFRHKSGHREGWIDECADALMKGAIMFSQRYQERIEEDPPLGTDARQQLEDERERERLMRGVRPGETGRRRKRKR